MNFDYLLKKRAGPKDTIHVKYIEDCFTSLKFNLTHKFSMKIKHLLRKKNPGLDVP